MNYTAHAVSRAVNHGADMVIEGLGLDERDTNLVNVVVNSIMTALYDPKATFLDVIEENWDEEDNPLEWSWGR